MAPIFLPVTLTLSAQNLPMSIPGLMKITYTSTPPNPLKLSLRNHVLALLTPLLHRAFLEFNLSKF